MRTPFLIPALLLFVATACSADPLGPDALAVADVDVFPAGPVSDSVVVSVTVENPSRTPIRIPHCFEMDLEARTDGGELVWRRFDGYVFSLCAPGYDELLRAETRTWSATWSLVDDDRERVAPGTYRLTPVLRQLTVPGDATIRAEAVTVLVL